MSSCCSPEGRSLSGRTEAHGNHGTQAGGSPEHFTLAVPPRGTGAAHDDVAVPAGTFAMGDPFDEGYPADGESPVHEVSVSAFRIDATAVTNAQFAAFVEAVGYRTESEIYGTSAVFHLAVQAEPADVLGTAAGTPWWLNVRGADWAHPAGPKSDWRDAPEHPVVQVSHSDALAYCAWAGRALPTEAQWEYAARGGLVQARYPWGNELHGAAEDGTTVHRCNIWQGTFPTENTGDDGFLTTAPVRSFEPNGYGLFQTSGNVWEWCADRFDRQTRAIRGGSYLCHASYCNRYRVAARSFNTPDSSTGNMGFRVARDA
jgi:sulfatase modifying factor 1